MTKLDRDATASFLREVLRRRAVRLTCLAEALQIPYRSLQNYFSKNAMPLWVYEEICSRSGIDPAYPIKRGKVIIDRRRLAEALIDVLGDNLPALEADNIAPEAADKRSSADIRRDAQVLATLLCGRYELILEREDLFSSPLEE
jgi:hypothetical protein